MLSSGTFRIANWDDVEKLSTELKGLTPPYHHSFIWLWVIPYARKVIKGTDKVWAVRIPVSCQCQLALSVHRLRALDPYLHQIQIVTGVLQVILLIHMLDLARRTTGYWHQCLTHYVDHVIQAHYPDLYRVSADRRVLQREIDKLERLRERPGDRARDASDKGTSGGGARLALIILVAAAVLLLIT